MAVQKMLVSPQDYLDAEAVSETKHEYIAGEIYEMPGGSYEHSQIMSKINFLLYLKLGGKKCIPHGSDLKIRIGAAIFYPDFSVVCGAPEFFDGRDDVIVNPVLLGEVLSKSTENFDRGGKFARYRQIEPLKTYLTVAQDRPEVVLHERQENRWVLTEFTNLTDSVELVSLGISLSLAEIYEDVTFPEAVIVDF